MNKKTILSVQITWAGYGSKQILRDVSFSIDKGQFLSIIAPNGTGKSTLLRCIAGVLPVKSGEIILLDKNVNRYSRREIAKQLAVVSEDNAVFDYSVYQTVLMGRFAHVSRFGGEALQEHSSVCQILKNVNMWEKRDEVMSKLSQGEKQRVLIARALAQQPKILLLDEPTAHLDICNQFKVMNLIKQLMVQHQLAVVAVIHDLNIALEFSTHLLLLKGGEVVGYGKAEEVISADILYKLYDLEFVLHRNTKGIYVQPCYK